jgi:hypothetical protein
MTKLLYVVTWKGHGRRQVWHIESDSKVHFQDLCTGNNENHMNSLKTACLMAQIESGTSKIGRSTAKM